MRYQRRGAERANERHLRRAPTNAEVLGWHLLRDRKIGAKFRRQHRIGGFIVDFYSVELRLGIELDGAPHLTEDGKRYDDRRTRALEALNVRIERFENDWALASPERFFARVKEIIEERKEEISKQRSRIIRR